ncbi:N-acetylmuramic acid 6-phosphate etherase, partial [Candidatus Bathyarchaeota archaeon]|nr:N-acetylmuramic acid 6-phosphate etherase [Candidatus Bathyarchaeota archaeon]
PYVLGVVEKARQMGVETVGVSCNHDTPLSRLVDVAVEVVVGPEVVAGSTRMKAGTAQKMVLNMMTTTALIRLGYVYDGLMVGVQATNSKLKERSKRIVSEITGASAVEAEKALLVADWDVRVAVLMVMLGMSPGEALEELTAHTLREIIVKDGRGN